MIRLRSVTAQFLEDKLESVILVDVTASSTDNEQKKTNYSIPHSRNFSL